MKKWMITSVLSGIFFTSLPVVSTAQIITTVAGVGMGDDSVATKAELNPIGIARDNAGNIYIADEVNNCVRKINAAGVISTFAGNGRYGYSGDGGPATAASFGSLYSVALDRNGNVYVADVDYSCIRKIDASGFVSTVAGTGAQGDAGDNGPATAAELDFPSDVAVDSAGNVFFTEYLGNRIRKINTTGIITTVAGNGTAGEPVNGSLAIASEVADPFRLTIDKKGNLYFGESPNICKIDTAGIITIIAGSTTASGNNGDGGQATAARLGFPTGLAIDSVGNLYFSDIGYSHIRKVDMNTGIISAYAASSIIGYNGDNIPATDAQFASPEGLVCDADGNLLICDLFNNRVRKVTNTTGTISTFAGQNGLFGEGYSAVDAELWQPADLATDTAGNIYIADMQNNRIRKINAATGVITTVAGNGIAGPDDGFSGDGGPATAAQMFNPIAVAVDDQGNIYIADDYNNRIRKVNTSGTISTIAGDNVAGYGGDNGAAVYSELNEPTGVAVDHAGNVYIADLQNSRIRKINSAGTISTIAGNGTAGYSGDNGPATAASIAYPYDVTVDNIGNVYFSDNGNSSIREVDTAGIITTIAGMGTPGYSGDGMPATDASLENPGGVRVDNAGNVYIADFDNQRVRMVNTSGIITTIAGNGTQGFGGDGGSAVNALLNNPVSLALDHSGNLFIADGGNNRVRKITLPLAVPTTSAAAMNVYVYPNPATNTINIVNAANCNVVIYDAVGKEVMSMPITATTQSIDINKLASGVYMLQVCNKDGATKMVKVVKE